MPLPDPYVLVEGPPAGEDGCRLRARSGLSPKTLEQESRALAGSWAACHVTDGDGGPVVGMGRVIGDGGWYFHIVDMAVDPDHQRRGIGDTILGRLLEVILAAAPPDAYISLLADEPGRPLYRRHGFVESAPRSIGMVLPPNAGQTGGR